MPSQLKPPRFGSTSSNSSRCWRRWNFLKDFWHTSVTKNCLGLLNESYWRFGFHQSLSLFVLAGKLLSHHREAWLERYWFRGIGHTWNTYQGLFGKRIGMKVVKTGDAFKKRKLKSLLSYTPNFQGSCLQGIFILSFLSFLFLCFISELRWSDWGENINW